MPSLNNSASLLRLRPPLHAGGKGLRDDGHGALGQSPRERRGGVPGPAPDAQGEEHSDVPQEHRLREEGRPRGRVRAVLSSPPPDPKGVRLQGRARRGVFGGVAHSHAERADPAEEDSLLQGSGSRAA